MTTFYKYNKVTLTYNKVRLWPYVLLIGSAFLFTSGITIKHMVVERIPIVIKATEQPLNIENIREQLDRLNIKHKNIVLRQILLETNYLRSQSCLVGHNLTGMKCAYQRNKIQSGEYLNHAAYSSWEESLIDYALFQSTYCSDIKTDEEYYNFLNQYAEDPNYNVKLKNIKINE